jgi:hypothetical protein
LRFIIEDIFILKNNPIIAVLVSPMILLAKEVLCTVAELSALAEFLFWKEDGLNVPAS